MKAFIKTSKCIYFSIVMVYNKYIRLREEQTEFIEKKLSRIYENA